MEPPRSETTKKTRLLLVDDQLLFVENLCTVLKLEAEDFEIIGTAYSGSEAIEIVREQQPDMVLLDVRMADTDGVEATRIIMSENPNTKIVMLTLFDEDQYVCKALEHGAVGYLLKNIPPYELLTSIRAIRNGAVLMSPEVASKVVKMAYKKSHLDMADLSEEEETVQNMKYLSKREIEVLMLIGQGLGNKQVVDRLCIAEQTVRNHISNIYAKLGVHDRYEAMQVAIKARLV